VYADAQSLDSGFRRKDKTKTGFKVDAEWNGQNVENV